MYFNNVVNDIAYLIIVYYVTYRNKLNNMQISMKDITPQIMNHVKNTLTMMFCRRYDIDEVIHSIDLLEWPNDKSYNFGYDENNPPFLSQEIIDDIAHTLVSYIVEHNTIHNKNNVISIDICPFDGMSIDHGTIMSILDLYFY